MNSGLSSKKDVIVQMAYQKKTPIKTNKRLPKFTGETLLHVCLSS